MRNIQYDSVWKLFNYDKSRGVVLTSLCVRVMCVRESIKAARIYIYIYIYIYINWSPPMFKTWLRPCNNILIWHLHIIALLLVLIASILSRFG